MSPIEIGKMEEGVGLWGRLRKVKADEMLSCLDSSSAAIGLCLGRSVSHQQVQPREDWEFQRVCGDRRRWPEGRSWAPPAGTWGQDSKPPEKGP